MIKLFKKFWNWGWGVYHKNEEVWNYLIVGGLTTFVAFIFFFIPNSVFNLNYVISETISWIIAVIFAYITNRIFVFKSKDKNIGKEAVKFVGSRVITYFVGVLTLYLFIDLLNVGNLISKIIQQIIITILNYFISKVLVFTKKKTD